MADQLKGKRVAALATHGFEQDELLQPRTALVDAGATVHIVSLESGRIRGWKHKEWGEEVSVDRTLDQARADEYDALLLPGGVMNPDRLRNESEGVMQVDLTTEEAATLKALLRDCITDLKREIARADDRQFRHELVQREELCERLIARLDGDKSRSPSATAL